MHCAFVHWYHCAAPAILLFIISHLYSAGPDNTIIVLWVKYISQSVRLGFRTVIIIIIINLWPFSRHIDHWISGIESKVFGARLIFGLTRIGHNLHDWTLCLHEPKCYYRGLEVKGVAFCCTCTPNKKSSELYNDEFKNRNLILHILHIWEILGGKCTLYWFPMHTYLIIYKNKFIFFSFPIQMFQIIVDRLKLKVLKKYWRFNSTTWKVF